MLLTITYESHDGPASDLGYLLHKHPGKLQSLEVTAGIAHIFYPEASPERCTAALLLEVDPIALVRGRTKNSDAFALGQYVNDRPYAASSMLAVALARAFRTAMSGRCDARPELAATELDLQVHLPAVPCSGGGGRLASRLFEPLGWQVDARTLAYDPAFPDWGDSHYLDLRLTGKLRLSRALEQLYVLLPVLDNAKHYWVGADEVEKLLRVGGEWLGSHPDRELITRRYLANQRSLVSTAVDRLAESDDTDPDALPDAVEEPKVRQPPLVKLRRQAVIEAIRASGAKTVIDLGCGEGRLVGELLSDPAYDRVAGIDVSPKALEQAARKLRVEGLSERTSGRLHLFQSSLTYRDKRLTGYDAAILMEVIEHLDPPRLPALASNVFGFAKPATVLVTTPNVEYNELYGSLEHGEHRHRDHRFEWTRAQFRAWAETVATTYSYGVRFVDIGDADERLGAPTQMAVFSKQIEEEAA